MLLKIIFPILFFGGLYFLIKSITSIVALYSRNRIDVDATQSSFSMRLDHPGEYEIAVKRSQFAALAPHKVRFHVVDKRTDQALPVRNLFQLFGITRTNLSGERTITIAEFAAPTATEIELHNPESQKFRAKDRLIVMPKTGVRGLLLILAIVFSGMATMGGLVLSLIFLSRPS